MERYFFYSLYLLLGCSLYGCSGKQAPKQIQNPDTEATIPYADTIAASVPPAPAKSLTARYLDSLGFVNIAEADSSIAIDLMYTRADNFTGTILYEDLKEAYLHPDAMKSLKQAQRLLKERRPGYSLIVYDAARPLSVQQKMWDVVKGTSKYIYVSNPRAAVACTTTDWQWTSAYSTIKEPLCHGHPDRPSGQGSPHHGRSHARGTRQADGTRT